MGGILVPSGLVPMAEMNNEYDINYKVWCSHNSHNEAMNIISCGQ